MNKELEELFEISNNNAPQKPQKSIVKHILVRFSVLVVLYGLLILWLYNSNNTSDGIGILYIGLFFIPIAWFAYLIIESIILLLTKRKTAFYIDLALFLITILFYIMVLAAIA